MRRPLWFLLLLIPLCLSLIITGCGLQDLLGTKKKSFSKTAQNPQNAIAVALSKEDPNEILIKKGIDDMAKKDNTQIKYLSENEGSQSQGNQSQGSQAQQSSKSPLEGAKVLIYQGGGNQKYLQAAQEKKVPVLALGQIPAGITPVAVVMPDQEKTGELMAQALVAKVQDGQVVILEGDPNESAAQELLAGNRTVLSKYPKIAVQVISSPSGTESVARQKLSEYLLKNKGKVKGILAHTEKLAAQAAEVLKQEQLTKTVALVGGQANIQSLQRIASNTQLADVDTSPYIQGANAYQWAQKIVNKQDLDVSDSVTSDQGEIPAKIVSVKAVTPDNLALIQKSYATTIKSAEQEQQKAQSAASGPKKSSNSKSDSSQNKSQNSGSSSSGSQSSSSQGSQQSQAMPSGVSKVTERVRTETTREYLDSKGKVIGTETNTTEQVRTVPPEMLQQEAQQKQQSQSQGQGGQGGGQGGQGQQDQQGDSGGQ